MNGSPHKSEGKRPLSEIIEDLNKPIPDRHLDQKRRGGETLTFCPWHKVIRMMEYFTNGHWEKQVNKVETTDRRVFVTVTVLIRAEDGVASREATGTERLYKVDNETGEMQEIPYGDPTSNAESMAFRRACANFGLGLGLYDG